jgi:hypothetical protein
MSGKLAPVNANESATQPGKGQSAAPGARPGARPGATPGATPGGGE